MPNEEAMAVNQLAEFEFKFSGRAVEHGLIDVRYFAPSALAVASLVDETAKILYGQDIKASVHLKADFHRGSFVSILAVDVSIFQQLVDYVTSSNEALEAIKWLLGGGSFLGFLELLRFLRNRKDADVEAEITRRTETYVQFGDFKFQRRCFEQRRNPKLREPAEEMVRPLQDPEIESMQFSLPTLAHQMIIPRSEREHFFFPPGDGNGETFTYRGLFEVISPTLGYEYVWRLKDIANSRTFTASIQDDKFSKVVSKGGVAFSHGSKLDAELQVVVRERDDGKQSLQYRVLKVYEVISPTEQTGLNFTLGGENES